MQRIETLATKAAELMMRGAVEFIHSRGIQTADVDLDALIIELRSRSAGALDIAIRDAKEALDASPAMEQIAEVTFASTMRLAGIESAKAVING
jgi:hypothetical protein